MGSLAKLRKSVETSLIIFRNFDISLMHVIWTFRCYVAPSGRDMIDKWYRAQSLEAQAAFDAVREYLAQRTRDEWRRPEFDLLSGAKFRVLGELRFEVANVQYRPLGFFGPARAEFTLLVGATKKGKVYDPRNAMDTALRRRTEVLKNPSRSRICDL